MTALEWTFSPRSDLPATFSREPGKTAAGYLPRSGSLYDAPLRALSCRSSLQFHQIQRSTAASIISRRPSTRRWRSSRHTDIEYLKLICPWSEL